MTGDISLSRKIIEWGWYRDANTLRVFLHLLLIANWRPSEYLGKAILRGQCVTGRLKLAKDLKLSEKEVRTALNHLKSTGEVTIKATSRFSIITIVKYDVYQRFGAQEGQQSGQQNGQQGANNGPTNGQQRATSEESNKEIKKEGNKEIIESPSSNQIPFKQIIELYNEICVSFPKVTSVSEARKKQINARWKQHPSIEAFRLLFSKAESSAFLKGHNDRNWSANFDWMTKDANMPKILEGQYDTKKSGVRNGSGKFKPDFSDPSRYENADGDENPFE